MVRILAAALFVVSVLPAAAAPDRQVLKQKCHDDYKALCSGVMPGGGRIIACLRAHMDKLSPACKAALGK